MAMAKIYKLPTEAAQPSPARQRLQDLQEQVAAEGRLGDLLRPPAHAKALGHDLDRAAETSPDKGAELDAHCARRPQRRDRNQRPSPRLLVRFERNQSVPMSELIPSFLKLAVVPA